MNRTLITGRIVVSGAFALTAALGTAGVAVADDAAPTARATATQQAKGNQGNPHQEEADGSDHGSTGKPAKDDPNAGKGKDCDPHGKHGGVNEDHCGPAKPEPTTPEPTKPTDPKPEPTKPTDPEPEPTTPVVTPPADDDCDGTEPTCPADPEPTKPVEEPTKPAEPTDPAKPGDDDCDVCKTVEVPAPVVVPVCGADNDTVKLPQAEGVVWQKGEWKDGHITITAVSADSFTFPQGDVVTFTFDDAGTPCPVPVTPDEDCDGTKPTCPTEPTKPVEPTKPEPTKPVLPQAPVTSTPVTTAPKGEVVKAEPVAPKGADTVVVEHVTVVAGSPVAPATTTEVKPASNAAPVFESGVEGEQGGQLGLVGAGLAVLAGAGLVARRRVNA